jgi:hypothetical protein
VARNDFYFECAELDDHFDIEFKGDYGLEEAINICGRSATFPAGSLSDNTQLISSAAIVTDDFWLTETDIACYDLKSAPSNPSAPSPPASPPTASPVSPFPTAGLPTEYPTEVKVPVQSPIEQTRVPTKQPTSPSIAVPVEAPDGQRSVPTAAPKKSSSNAGAIAGGSVAGVAIVAIVAFLLIRKKDQSDSSYQKPPGSGWNASASESNTDANTVFRENSAAAPTVVASPYAAPNSSHENDIAMAQPPLQSSPNRMSYSGTPLTAAGSYDVRYKDQARSVLGTSQVSVPMVVPGVPITDAIPIAVPMDTSGASGNSRNSIKSEPPGRRGEDP